MNRLKGVSESDKLIKRSRIAHYNLLRLKLKFTKKQEQQDTPEGSPDESPDASLDCSLEDYEARRDQL